MSDKNDRELTRVTVLYGPNGNLISTSKQFTRVERVRFWNWKRTVLFVAGVILAACGTVLWFVRS